MFSGTGEMAQGLRALVALAERSRFRSQGLLLTSADTRDACSTHHKAAKTLRHTNKINLKYANKMRFP